MYPPPVWYVPPVVVCDGVTLGAVVIGVAVGAAVVGGDVIAVVGVAVVGGDVIAVVGAAVVGGDVIAVVGAAVVGGDVIVVVGACVDTELSLYCGTLEPFDELTSPPPGLPPVSVDEVG